MVVKVIVWFINVNDSGGVDVFIEDVISRISFLRDFVVVVGVVISSLILVLLLYENGEIWWY